MAPANPILLAYPIPPPSCSKNNYCIAGILATVYGLDELNLARPHCNEIATLWLLHPRLLEQSSMEPIAYSSIQAWNDHVRASDNGSTLPGLIAVTFDQRNHGSREVDPKANQDWRSGNETHAQDMFASYRS